MLSNCGYYCPPNTILVYFESKYVFIEGVNVPLGRLAPLHVFLALLQGFCCVQGGVCDGTLMLAFRVLLASHLLYQNITA